MLRKKLIKSVVLITLMVVGISSFALGEEQTPYFQWLRETSKPYVGTQLKVINLEQPYSKGIDTFIPEFEKLTGMKVSQETMGQVAVTNKITTELAARTGFYDLLWVEGATVPQYAAAGWIEPIDSYISSPTTLSVNLGDFIQSVLNALRYPPPKGKLYSLPFFAATVIMYYRKDIFDRYGVAAPDTIEEMVEVCKKVHTKDMPAIALRGKPHRAMNIWHWSYFLYGLGGNYFRDFPDDMYPTLDSPAAIKATDIYGQLLRNYSIPGAQSATYDDVVIAMQQGRVAMVTEGAPLGARILDPEKSKVMGKVGFRQVPRGPAGRFPPFTAQGLAIARDSKNKEAAYLFLQWATSREILLKIALSTRHVSVTRNSVWQDPDFIKKYDYNWGAGSYVEEFQRAIQLGPWWYRPPFPEWPEVGDLVGIRISEATSGIKTPEQAMKDAQSDVLKIIQEANYLEKGGVYK